MFERPGWQAVWPLLTISVIGAGWGASACLKREYDGIGEPTPGQGFGESTAGSAGAGTGGSGGYAPDAEPVDASAGTGGQPEAGPDVGPDADVPDVVEPDVAGYPDGGPKPVMWLRFTQTDGPVVDEMGTSDGTVWGDVKRGQPGRIGKGFSFGPEAGRVRVPTKPAHWFENAATVELWYRRTPNDMNSTLINLGRHGEDNVSLVVQECGAVFASFKDFDPLRQAVASTECGAVQDDVWTHLAFTDDGLTLTLYIDVEPVGTDMGGVFFDLSGEIWIGDQNIPHWHVGEIDEVKWWTIARTQEEICYDAGGEWDGSSCTLE